VNTLIGDVDVVFDESALDKKPVEESIIKGHFWLIGYIDF